MDNFWKIINGPAPSQKHHAAHRDGNSKNNTPENIYWATPKENIADQFRHGTFHSKTACLGPEDRETKAILVLRASGTSWAVLSRAFERPVSTIRSTVRRMGRDYSDH